VGEAFGSYASGDGVVAGAEDEMTRLISKVLLLIMLPITSAFAKTIDPAPIVDGGMTYKSHDNYVEAFDSKSDKIIWKTFVYQIVLFT
jgi:hypothetical protein